jgi:hypothetical protein
MGRQKLTDATQQDEMQEEAKRRAEQASPLRGVWLRGNLVSTDV